MLLRFGYRVVAGLFGMLRAHRADELSKEVEIVVLRQQLAVLRRQVERPRFTWLDRAFVALFSKFVPRERWQGFLVTPQTVLDWHRRLVKGHWARKSRKPGRPPLPEETVELVRRLAKENPSWGYLRIVGEMKKLGVEVSKGSVGKRRDKPAWRRGWESPTLKAQRATTARSRASTTREGVAKRRYWYVQAGRMSREITFSGVPTLSTQAEGNTARSAIASYWQAPRGRRPLACTEPPCTRTGRPHTRPSGRSPAGPPRERRGGSLGRTGWGVGQARSTCEGAEQTQGTGSGGAGGKGPERGERDQRSTSRTQCRARRAK